MNKAWQGRRYKTKDYKNFERLLLTKLSNDYDVPNVRLKLSVEMGFSNRASDLSNPLKIVEDILQKKYGFNDNKIYIINLQKHIVAKGDEFICIDLRPI